jgi:hypothetical protein
LLNKENVNETEAVSGGEVKGGRGGGEFEIMMLPQDNGGSGQLRKTCVGPYNAHCKTKQTKD